LGGCHDHLIVLLAAVIVGFAGLLTNIGNMHALTGDFAVFGYHVSGSTGTLFLHRMVVGAVAVVGLRLLLADARRSSQRSRLARRQPRESRRENSRRDSSKPQADSTKSEVIFDALLRER
jgi:hypothetical protein